MVVDVLAVEVALRVLYILDYDVRLNYADRTVFGTDGIAEFEFCSADTPSRRISHVIDEVVLNDGVGRLGVPCPIGIAPCGVGIHVVGIDTGRTRLRDERVDGGVLSKAEIGIGADDAVEVIRAADFLVHHHHADIGVRHDVALQPANREICGA